MEAVGVGVSEHADFAVAQIVKSRRARIDADGDDIPDSSETIILNNEMPTGVDLYGGKIGTSVSTTHQTFELFDDGSTTENVVFVLRSDTTGESKAIRIKAINGWVDLIDDIPTI